MKHINYLLAGALVTSLPLSGCSILESKQKEAKTIINDAEDFEGTIHIVADESLASSEYFNASLDAFDEMHAKWNLIYDIQSGEYTSISASSGSEDEVIPDLYVYDASVAAYLASNSLIAELGGDTLKMMQSEITNTLINGITYNSAVYGVPYTANTYVLYYDTSVYKDSEVKKLSSLLKNGKVGISLSNSDVVSSFYLSNGLSFNVDTDTQITNYLLELIKEKNFVDSEDVSTLGDGLDAVIASTDSYEAAHDALGDKNLGVAVLPTYELNKTDIQMKSFINETFVAVNPESENIKVAVTLAQYLGSSSCSKDLFEEYGIIGANRAIEDEEFLSTVGKAFETSSTSRPSVTSSYQNYYSAFASLGQQILSGSITSDSAYDKTNEMINSLTAAIQ